ncbi:hypothetical protein O181_098185 [Austropuccinia psidii MF-1]|uniref:Uncharacterized protein n=1 Tax=Austropuccinia psidii MF-1 TaxID=1389203 RepID=A0A9Q3PEN2_9BASI|nr:hypothetical protein [Austropuccinia psidii MF-1]
MPIQHSPPARKTGYQARTQAVLTPTPRAPLDGTPAVPQLRAKLDRVPILEGRKRAKKIKGPGEDGKEEEENPVEEEESDGTEGVPAPVGASQGTEGPTLAQSNQPVSHQSEPSLLDIMQKITQIMANLQAASSSEASRPPYFKTTSMKEPEFFDGTQPFKVRTDFRSLVSRIGDWGERALIHHFRKGLPSRILDQLASHPSRIDSLQHLMDINLELDTRYHERQNEKSHHPEKKPEASKSNSSHSQNSLSSSQKKKKNFQKRDKPHSSLLNTDFKLMNSEKERRIKEGLCTYCGGKHSLESCSKGLKTNLPNHQANFPGREKPE